MRDTITTLSKVKLYGILMISTVICVACKSNAPRQEPYNHDNHVVFATSSASLPAKDQQRKHQKTGIVCTSENGCINAVLQVVARCYKQEIDAGNNALLQKIAHHLTDSNSNTVQAQEIEAFRSILPEPYSNIGYRGGADMLLKSIHDVVPCLGKSTYSLHYIPDERNRLSLISEIGSTALVSGQQFILNVYPILDHNNQLLLPASSDLSQLIRANQEKVSFTKYTYLDHASGMQHETQMKGIQKMVFEQLPDKLCLSFTRIVAHVENTTFLDNRDLLGTASIHITHDPSLPNSVMSHFALDAFLVASLNEAGAQHFVAFVQSDRHWYCFNDDKVTSISRDEAMVASKKGVLFFYSKK